MRPLAGPEGAAEEFFDAALAVELFEVGQAELVEEVLGGAPACCAAIDRTLFGTRHELLPAQGFDGAVAFGAADRGHLFGRDRLAQRDDGERLEGLRGERPGAALGAQAGDDILAIGPGLEPPLRSCFAQLQAAPGMAQRFLEQADELGCLRA